MMTTLVINKTNPNPIFMRNNLFDILSVFTINSFNVYTIFEIINNTAFPIILALGSVVLTFLLIKVQLKKLRLSNQQIKNEVLETQKKELEIKLLQDEEARNNPTPKLVK